MTVSFDDSPFGARRPGPLDRAVLALTTRLPANWLGLRLAILLRRITMARLGEGGLDVERFGLNLRLYPRKNGCEKGALFTPQMYEPMERRMIAEEARRPRSQGRPFLFVDIGANVGLFSLIAATLAQGAGRVLAIEPLPGIRERLAFNIAINPDLDVRHAGIALADQDREVELFVDQRDYGGTRIGGRGAEGISVRVRARRLLDVLVEEGFSGADVMKIDVEGTEDLVLEPFLREASEADLPRVILIEDSRTVWARDVFAMLQSRGYRATERGRQNIVFRRD